MATKKTITIEQVRSANRRPERQTQTLIGLGLNKLKRRSTLPDNAETRGALKKVQHLVRVVEDQ